MEGARVTSAQGSASGSVGYEWIGRSPLQSSMRCRSEVWRPLYLPPIMPRATSDVRQAMCRELEDARYEASLAARRYDLVDPTKRHVARELEARWNAVLERVAQLEDHIAHLDRDAALAPKIDRVALMQLAHDLPAAWNAPMLAAARIRYNLAERPGGNEQKRRPWPAP